MVGLLGGSIPTSLPREEKGKQHNAAHGGAQRTKRVMVVCAVSGCATSDAGQANYRRWYLGKGREVVWNPIRRGRADMLQVPGQDEICDWMGVSVWRHRSTHLLGGQVYLQNLPSYIRVMRSSWGQKGTVMRAGSFVELRVSIVKSVAFGKAASTQE